MHASAVIALLPVLMTGVAAQIQCHVRLNNNAGRTGCFNFDRAAFVRNTVFPLGVDGGQTCSITASPENNPNNPCAGFVNGVAAGCGTGRDISFTTGLC